LSSALILVLLLHLL